MGTEMRLVKKANFFTTDLETLELLWDEAQFGLMILDRELRLRSVNHRMSVIDGIPVADHVGRTLSELDPHISSALYPLVQQTLQNATPSGEHEIYVRGKFWLVRCHPLKGANGRVAGCGLSAQDVTARRQKEAAQDELLRVESLLSDLSTDFIKVNVSEVDAKIEEGLKRMVEFLDIDRISIWNLNPQDGKLLLVHSYAVPGTTPIPTVIVDLIPVWTSMVRKGEIFRVADIDECPDTFWQEKLYCQRQGGIKSMLFIPASVGGTVVGVITFVSYRMRKEWPDELTQRLRLLWEIFANAIERKRAEQKIQDALAEIRRLKDLLEAENIYLRDQINIEYKHEEIIGKSQAIKKVLLQVGQVAHTDSTVLIQGETGTGKELIARAIHNMSNRKGRAMMKVNCAALPAALIEAELFGHEKGAYTGAVTSRIGRFEAANGSTIFLDEIGELPLELQSKLLRVLQEGQFERLGSPKPIDVDVRVIAATNRNLAQEVAEGRFREDLYYRLNVFPVSVPPLRERREDISLLVWAMVEEFGKVFGKTIDRVPRKNLEAMERYPWPGNIRELRNLVERAMILCRGNTLIVEVPESSPVSGSSTSTIEVMERGHILSVLESTGWRIRGRNGAAEILGLKPTTLNSRMKKLGITRSPAPSPGPVPSKNSILTA